MRKISALFFALVLILGLIAPVSAAGSIQSPATGYTCAEDVEYVIVGGTVVNWGARGETCAFLTSYAETYYTDGTDWQTLSTMAGGTGTSDAAGSELYLALQALMKTSHTNIQGYQDTRPYYQYTDCVGSDYSQVSSFYSGKLVNGVWDGKTYNREHVWPKSKCINTSKKEDSADIMMLRPTISSENSSRGNKAYGESNGYFDPGTDVRGDCARMVLYGYVRWGNTGKMWGTSGVMESMEVLLKWMEEDPVDTWEMGRNDAVQSITGVRNVFVDYPEFAWILFGQEMPEDLTTPSGNAKAPAECQHTPVVKNEKEASCAEEGYTGDTYCADCDAQLRVGEVIPATGEHTLDEKGHCTGCDYQKTPEPTEPEPTEPSTTQPQPTEPSATKPSATEPNATQPVTSEPENNQRIVVIVAVSAVVVFAIGGVAGFVMVKKRRK